TFQSNTVGTSLDSSADFDGTFASSAADTVQTDQSIAASNPYTTGASLAGTQFATGLSVDEESAGSGNPNCPSTGCFGGQVIQFSITPLPGTSFPASFTLTWVISGQVIPNATKASDIVVTHSGSPVPLCSSGTTDPSAD